ncbi:MAG: amidohydrolase family protein [Steroidobacteraceae bacterium]|nr:amidohydrolase family protein [Steroidobacteraceae bacterium]MDW8258264.1 amidohydrolase family protein [Gammaproteobacteria bacterium]
MRGGYIDIVCNVFTPAAVRRGQTGLDREFKRQVRMPRALRGGVTIAQYLRKMDRAGIERSLLIAVRCGDLRVRGSFEIPYAAVARICDRYPDRFSGLAGIDPTRGIAGLRELTRAIREYGFVGAHWYPHWFAMPPNAPQIYPYYARCAELGVPIMLQVGHNLVYSRDRRLPSVGRPILLDQVAIDFPELTLIGIHIGVPWTDEMISMCWKHPNVYTAGDAYAPRHWPAAFVHYANTYGSHKVLFGTDWPVIDPERAVREIEALGLHKDSHRRLMRDNALAVFKKISR